MMWNIQVSRYLAASLIVFFVVATGSDVRSEVGEKGSAGERMRSSSKGAYEAIVASIQKGREPASAERLYTWSRRWMESSRAASNEADALTAIRAHRERMKGWEERTGALYKLGRLEWVEVESFAFFVAEADRWVEEAEKGK